MTPEDADKTENEGAGPVKAQSAPAAKAPLKRAVKSKAPGPPPAAARKPPAKAPAKKAPSPAAGKNRKAAPGKGRAARAPARALAKSAPKKGPARTASGPDRRLDRIRDWAAELSRALDAVEKARAALGESFDRAAAANLSRALSALGTLGRLAESGPLVDVRRLERELALLAEDVGDLRDRERKGRKRDLLAVDEFLGNAAARLELAVTPAAGSQLKLLSERLSGLEALRRSHQAAIDRRFAARLEGSRRVLGALADSCAGLEGRALDDVARELRSAVGLCKAFPVGRLQGKPGDLYGIDGLVKRLDRRMARVQALLGRRKEPSGG